MSAHAVDAALADDLVIDLRDRPDVDRTRAAALGLDIEVPSPTYVRLVKPTLDRLVAAVLVLVLLPALLAIAIVVRASLGRGVLFRQVRIGRGGAPFTVYKFRTMLPDRRSATMAFVGEDRRRTHKTADDPRHTPVGRFLRRWSLDELPQLFNVVRGDMSLVGPRPELPHIVERYQPWEHARHAVRPGLTGFWQTSARGSGPMHHFTRLDIDYVRAASARTDLVILLRTVPALLSTQRGS